MSFLVHIIKKIAAITRKTIDTDRNTYDTLLPNVQKNKTPNITQIIEDIMSNAIKSFSFFCFFIVFILTYKLNNRKK